MNTWRGRLAVTQPPPPPGSAVSLETRSHTHRNSRRTRLAFYSATCFNYAPVFPSLSCRKRHHVMFRYAVEASDKNLSSSLTDRGEPKPPTAARRRPIPLAPAAPEIGPVFVRGSITGMRPPPSASPWPSPRPPRETLVVCGVSEVETSSSNVIKGSA